jgi:hypothetical protein
LPCWGFNRRFSAESAINVLDRSQKVGGIPEWMARCRQLESIVPQVLQLNIVPKRMKAKPAPQFSGGDLDGYAETGESVQQGARANAGICHAACFLTMIEANPRIADPNPARSAPAPGVAHL